MSDLVGNPEDRFSRDAAQLSLWPATTLSYIQSSDCYTTRATNNKREPWADQPVTADSQVDLRLCSSPIIKAVFLMTGLN